MLREGQRLCEVGADFRHPRVLPLREIRSAKRASVFNPLLREGIGLRIVVKAADRFCQLRVIPPLAHQFQKLRKGGVVFLIKFLQRNVHRLAAQEGQLPRVEDFIIRREIEPVKIFAHEIIAEAVDRADGGARQQHLLAQ